MARKILVIHSSNELFGSDLVLLRAVDVLLQSGWAPLVLLPDDLPYTGLLSQELQERRCPVRSLELGILRRKYLKPLRLPAYLGQLFLAVLKVRNLIRQERAEVVYSATSAVLCGALAARLAKCRHVWHVHEVLARPRLLVRLLGWMLFKFSEQVIAVSRAVAAHWSQVEPRLAEKIRVIYNGLDLGYYTEPRSRPADRKALHLSNNDVLIGCLGRIGSWKGQEVLLQALARVQPHAPQVKCLLAGSTVPGEENKIAALKQLIQGPGLGSKVMLRDFQKDIRPWLNAMDIMAVPSVKPDPFPTVTLEAMAFSLPVVAANHGGLPEMVAEGETGYLTPPGDAEALAAAILKLAQDRKLRQRMGAAGRKRLEKLFPLQKFQREIMHVFEFSRSEK